jgi:hypothetical protein
MRSYEHSNEHSGPIKGYVLESQIYSFCRKAWCSGNQATSRSKTGHWNMGKLLLRRNTSFTTTAALKTLAVLKVYGPCVHTHKAHADKLNTIMYNTSCMDTHASKLQHSAIKLAIFWGDLKWALYNKQLGKKWGYTFCIEARKMFRRNRLRWEENTSIYI